MDLDERQVNTLNSLMNNLCRLFIEVTIPGPKVICFVENRLDDKEEGGKAKYRLKMKREMI